MGRRREIGPFAALWVKRRSDTPGAKNLGSRNRESISHWLLAIGFQFGRNRLSAFSLQPSALSLQPSALSPQPSVTTYAGEIHRTRIYVVGH